MLISRLFFTVRFSGAKCRCGRNSFSCNTHQGNFGVDASSLFWRLSEAGERHNRIKLCTPITPWHLLTFRDAGRKVWTVNKNYHRHLCKCCVCFLQPIPDHRTAVTPLDSVLSSWRVTTRWHTLSKKRDSPTSAPFRKITDSVLHTLKARGQGNAICIRKKRFSAWNGIKSLTIDLK